jgi:NADH-quinone oxidoreductase subunit J
MAHVAFFVIAAIAVASALGLILRPNAIHGALFLVVKLAVPVGGLLLLLLIFVVIGRWSVPPGPVGPSGSADALGRLLFTSYLFPFELTSVLLLAAMVGVLLLARRRPG